MLRADYLSVSIPDNVAIMLGSTSALRYNRYQRDANPGQQGGIKAVAADFRADLCLSVRFSGASRGFVSMDRLWMARPASDHDFEVEVTDGDLGAAIPDCRPGRAGCCRTDRAGFLCAS